MYANCLKRMIDFILSLVALLVLFPVFLVLILVGVVAMKGNPFFVQPRPGKISRKTGEERIIHLIKFRTMTYEKDDGGNLLRDEHRLNRYGRFLRNTSLDELPSLLNILKGDMAICGPRPLLVAYLPIYTEAQRRRHTVRPGLTGYAQVNGRNLLSWEEKMEKDLYYVDHMSFGLDVKIVLKTVAVVFKREGISSPSSATAEGWTGSNTGKGKDQDHV